MDPIKKTGGYGFCTKGPSEDAAEIRTDGTPTAILNGQREGGKWFGNSGGRVGQSVRVGYGLRMVGCSDMIYELILYRMYLLSMIYTFYIYIPLYSLLSAGLVHPKW